MENNKNSTSVQADSRAELKSQGKSGAAIPHPYKADDKADICGQALQGSKTEQRALEKAAPHREELVSLALKAARFIGAWNWDITQDTFTADACFASFFTHELTRAVSGIPLAEFLESIHPLDRAGLEQKMYQAVETAGEFSTEYRLQQKDGSLCWILALGRVYYNDQNKPINFPGVAIDITKRKFAEIRQAALLELGDRLRDLKEISDIAHTAAEILGQTLDAGRAGYAKVDATERFAYIERDWSQGALPSMAGIRRFSDYGAAFAASLKRGEILVIEDALHHPVTAGGEERLKAMHIASMINAPLLEDGKLLALIYIHHEGPRVWAEAEVDFVRNVVDRTWAAAKRARAEQERDRFFAITEDLLVIAGFDGYFKRINPAWEEVLGWTHKELTARPWSEFVHPDDVDATKMAIQKASNHQVSLPFESRYRHKSGQYRWLSWKIRKFPEEHLIYGSASDITWRKESEQALLLSEDRWRVLTEAMPQLVWIDKADGWCEYLSKQWVDYTGVPVKELLGYEWLNVVHPDDRERVAAAWADAVADKAPYDLDYRIRRHDGIYRWFRTRGIPIRDEHSNILKWYGTCTDVDEQKRDADTLRAVKEHLSLMVESTIDFAIISMDAQGRIISWNPGAERIFGFKVEEVVGQLTSIIFTPEDRLHGMHEKEMQTAARTGRASDERWHLRKDGSRFFASGILAAMRSEKGQLLGFTKIARDVTAQKKAEDQLIQARNEAEAANIAKSEFLANMSHEIRTPMNAVIGLSNILASSEPLTSRQKEFINTLQLSAEALLELLNNLLDISKIEARTIELEHIPFCMEQMVQEVISMMSVKAQEKNLTFTLEGECIKGWVFMGDPTRLRQIILNLCSNAVKFTEHGGIAITLTCQTLKPGVENIRIAIKDTGIGIARDKLPTIFGKFVQADTSINRKYGGSGLGLAITQRLVEIMAGTLEVESEPGKGSVFTVSLPLEVAKFQGLESNISQNITLADVHVEKSARPSILLVEDHAPNVLVASTFLEQFGYEVHVAHNGIEALEKVKTGHFMAVLMDVQMHGMNGLEATRLIREVEARNQLPRLPIIGMTAHAMAGDRERCINAGMDDYIAKPFNPDILKDKLIEHVKTLT